jgi:hypothetical protein
MRQRGDVISGGSYASSNDQRLYFGLGESTSVESIEIHWPSGKVEKLTLPAVDPFYTIEERRRPKSNQVRSNSKRVTEAGAKR